MFEEIGMFSKYLWTLTCLSFQFSSFVIYNCSLLLKQCWDFVFVADVVLQAVSFICQQIRLQITTSRIHPGKMCVWQLTSYNCCLHIKFILRSRIESVDYVFNSRHIMWREKPLIFTNIYCALLRMTSRKLLV